MWTPLNGCFQNSLPDILNSFLTFVRVTCRMFILFCEGGKSFQLFCFLVSCYQFFIFFNFIWFCHFYYLKSKLFFYFYIFWNLLYILFWKFEAYSFPIFDWLKTSVPYYFEKKSHMINQESRASAEVTRGDAMNSD